MKKIKKKAEAADSEVLAEAGAPCGVSDPIVDEEVRETKKLPSECYGNKAFLVICDNYRNQYCRVFGETDKKEAKCPITDEMLADFVATAAVECKAFKIRKSLAPDEDFYNALCGNNKPIAIIDYEALNYEMYGELDYPVSVSLPIYECPHPSDRNRFIVLTGGFNAFTVVRWVDDAADTESLEAKWAYHAIYWHFLKHLDQSGFRGNWHGNGKKRVLMEEETDDA